MDLRPLGKRDIFGILLPGTVLIFVSAYVFFGVLLLLGLGSQVKGLLEQEFLLTVGLFVAAYLVGSLLRLVASDDVDKESSKYLLEKWRQAHPVGLEQEKSFKEIKAEYAKGNGEDTDVPAGFDDWLFRVDEFPYPAWQNRKWQAHGPREVLDFYRGNYRTSMWSESKASPKDFFNHCKLTIIGSGGPLVDEVNAAEGLTRFFAGTVAALQLSIRLLVIVAIIQTLFVAGLILAPDLIAMLSPSAEIRGSVLGLVFTLVIASCSRWTCNRIVRRFRGIRSKEVMTVYHAFYLDWKCRQGQKGE